MHVTSIHRTVAVALLAALGTAAPSLAGPAPATSVSTASAGRDDRIRAAIATAVHARMGRDAEVAIDALNVTGDPGSPYLQAVPEPNARLGDRMHFRLLGSAGRGDTPRVAGSVSALVSVIVEHVRARALVPRGHELGDGDVEVSHDALGVVPLRRLPRLSEVAGTRALVNLAPGEIVARTAVAMRPAVKSGQLVRATARVGGLVVTAGLVAVQDGSPGAIIRVVNKDSRRELRALVVEPGVVEVIP